MITIALIIIAYIAGKARGRSLTRFSLKEIKENLKGGDNL